MSNVVLLDSSVLIANLRTGCFSDRIAALAGRLRMSSVVRAELLRGALSAADRKIVAGLPGSHLLLTPTEKNWVESGEILADIQRDKGYDKKKIRDLHFDVLIALTARARGARLITSNRADFALICGYREFKLEVW